MGLINTFGISASGLVAQRVRLQTVASNMANARTTRTPEGGPYVRQLPVLQAVSNDFGSELDRELSRVEVADVVDSTEPFVLVYEPGHPDADASGYVRFPNVDVLKEMVDLMTTARTYEANTNVVDVTKRLAMAAIDIGRG